MLGAVIGDIAGSRFEFDQGGKTKNFVLLAQDCGFTDDTVMSAAVAETLMEAGKDAGEEEFKRILVSNMKKWGRYYPYAGYGCCFGKFLDQEDPKPYNSWGNGSAMRVSPVGWFFDSLNRTLEVARWSAEVSHNHPEGIKGAQCTAAVIYLARNGADKNDIRTYVIENFGYDVSESLSQLRARHEHNESCMDSLPKALVSFFKGKDYEDVIRNAISLGGDADTLAAIAGGMAEGMYPIPEGIAQKADSFLDREIRKVLRQFYEAIGR